MKYHTLFLLKIRKDVENLSSDAVVIGALRVKPLLVFAGQLISIGGSSGVYAEPGAAGSMYLHRKPDYTETGEIPTTHVENRTLQVNNNGQKPMNTERNLTSAYGNRSEASCITWIFPGNYPDDVQRAIEIENPTTDLTFDYLQIYRNAQLALLASINSTDYADHVNLTTWQMGGDRTGKLHVGHNQTLYIGDGQIPSDLNLYGGSDATLQGELRVAGVYITISGRVSEVQNITIVDGGK